MEVVRKNEELEQRKEELEKRIKMLEQNLGLVQEQRRGSIGEVPLNQTIDREVHFNSFSRPHDYNEATARIVHASPERSMHHRSIPSMSPPGRLNQRRVSPSPVKTPRKV